jgi:uncharacterized protein YyaL (SSP411 family)
MAAVDWSAWTAGAFARARAEKKPVLLSIAVPWCYWCREMDRTSYADPHVAARVNDRFVAIRVDADRRPDIGERYSLGGWPTTAFLTADGDVIGGGTYVAPDRLPSVLDRVVDAMIERREEIQARARVPDVADDRLGPATVASEPELLRIIYGAFDRAYGGFGGEPKFPLTAALDLALAVHRQSDDSEHAHIARSTLDAMGWGGLYDEVDGGFFRYAATRDWQMPHVEKLLDVNARLLRVYVDASATLQLTRYRERAVDVLRYLQTWLADPVDGGWAGSQQADRAYYEGRTGAARQLRPAPPVDRVLYAGWNATMVSSALHAAQALDDPALGEFAMKSLERVLLACYRPGAGVAHYLDGEPAVRGLLDDQMAMAAASLDAYEATGNVVYEMMAEELAHYALRTMWDDHAGGFFDRATPDDHERIGLMRLTLKPFVANCDAARVLRRIAEASGNHDFEVRASETLAAMAPHAAQQGPLAAHFILASRD